MPTARTAHHCPVQSNRGCPGEGIEVVLTGPHIILTLKVAVLGVTLLLLTSLVALSRGNYKLHGRINRAFFLLTLATLLGLEAVVRFVDPSVFDYLSPETKTLLTVHLCFAVPAALLLPVMLF